MIPKDIERVDVLKAIEKVKTEGVPEGRHSTQYSVIYENRLYPPKVLISFANVFRGREEIDPAIFSGGPETNGFLDKLGFQIVNKDSLDSVYPIEASSWTILNGTVALKLMDRSCILHGGSGIPVLVRDFFGIGEYDIGDRKEIVLEHGEKTYHASCGINREESPQSRIFCPNIRSLLSTSS